jgi:hypothetical protein
VSQVDRYLAMASQLAAKGRHDLAADMAIAAGREQARALAHQRRGTWEEPARGFDCAAGAAATTPAPRARRATPTPLASALPRQPWWVR